MSELSKQLGEYETDEERDKPIDDFVKANKEQFKKQLDSFMSEVFDQHYQWLEDNAPLALTEESVSRARQLLVAVLEGDEECAKALFECDSDRYVAIGIDKGEPWASVIHGKLHITDAQKLRAAIVEKHADMLQSERIKDLESQLEGVMLQLKKANKRLGDAGNPTVDW
jgi:hypothetical protein